MTEPLVATPPVPQPPARVRGLSCPSCGGALEVDPGVRVVVCPYCAAPLLAAGEAGVRRFAVEPAVDAAHAREAAAKWLAAGWNKDRALPREAAFADSFLTFLPFFRVQADVVGYALGTELRTRTVGSGKNRRTETYEVDVERPARKHFDRTFAAVNVAEWGVRKVDLTGDRLIPFDADALERTGMVFSPTGSEAEVRSDALERYKEEGDPARGLKRVRFRFLETLRERMSVIYYPLWILRYRFRGRSYQVVVDAQDGSLAFGKAPGNDLYRALMLIASEAAACFLFTTGLQWLATADSDDGCGVFLGLGAAALVIFGWGWKRFRYGGEVAEGTGLLPEEGQGTAWMRKLGELKAGGLKAAMEKARH
jgi:hypothetical protein